MANNRPTRYFGVTTDLSGNIGTGIIANSISTNKNTEVATAQDERGGYLDAASYAKSETLTIDGLFVGAGVDVGTKATIGGKDYLISNVTKNESNTAFQTASVTANGYDDFTDIHPLSSIQQNN